MCIRDRTNNQGTINATTNEGWNGAKGHSIYGLTSQMNNNKLVEAALVGLFNGLCRGVSQQQVQNYLQQVVNVSQGAGHEIYQKAIATCFTIYAQNRDCRGGKGERKSSQFLLIELYRFFPRTVETIVPLIPEYGYWKDLNQLLIETGTIYYDGLYNTIIKTMIEQIKEDYETLSRTENKRKDAQSKGLVFDERPNLTLLAKWIPKEGRHFDRTSNITSKLAEVAFPDLYSQDTRKALRAWRKTVSPINKELNTVEILMSKNLWSQIRFNLITGRNLAIYRRAYLNLVGGSKCQSTDIRHPYNNERHLCRTNLLEHLEKAKLGKVSIKGKALHLHEIIREMTTLTGSQISMNTTLSQSEKDIFELQWNDHRTKLFTEVRDGLQKAQEDPSTTPFDPRGVVMIDESGSMMCNNGIPILVANAIGLLLTELCQEFGGDALGNKFLSFESSPKWIELTKGETLFNRLGQAIRSSWGGNTNFLSAHELILDLCIKHRLKPDQLPKWFMVLSDMQWDAANSIHTIGKTIRKYCDPTLLSSFSHTTNFRGGFGEGTSHCRKTTPLQTHHQILKDTYAKVGIEVCGQPYPLPFTYYWNLNGEINSLPVQVDTPDTMMLSGFSTEMISLLFSGKISEIQQRNKLDNRSNSTPSSWDLLMTAMETKDNTGGYRYLPIHQAIKDCGETIFSDYLLPWQNKVDSSEEEKESSEEEESSEDEEESSEDEEEYKCCICYGENINTSYKCGVCENYLCDSCAKRSEVDGVPKCGHKDCEPKEEDEEESSENDVVIINKIGNPTVQINTTFQQTPKLVTPGNVSQPSMIFKLKESWPNCSVEQVIEWFRLLHQTYPTRLGWQGEFHNLAQTLRDSDIDGDFMDIICQSMDKESLSELGFKGNLQANWIIKKWRNIPTLEDMV